MEEIATWADLLACCQRYRDVRTHGDDRLRLTYELDGRAVPFGLQVIRAPTGTPWLACNVKVAPSDHLRARAALGINAELPIGGLCIALDHAVLRQSLPFRGLRVAHLEHTLRSLATLRAELVAAGADVASPYGFVFR